MQARYPNRGDSTIVEAQKELEAEILRVADAKVAGLNALKTHIESETNVLFTKVKSLI